MTGVATHVDMIFAGLGPSVLGFVYDYSPVPFSPDPDRFVLPEVIEARGEGERLVDDWCGQALYRADPVQARAARMSQPFIWSYHAGENTVLSVDLARDDVDAVRERLLYWGLGRGMTMPLHTPGGGFATVTAFLECSVEVPVLAGFALAACRLQDEISSILPRGAGPLSPRERECLRLTADGLSSKQIAWELDRSESMVVKHLQAAAAKLGARNRSHAVALATRHGWID